MATNAEIASVALMELIHLVDPKPATSHHLSAQRIRLAIRDGRPGTDFLKAGRFKEAQATQRLHHCRERLQGHGVHPCLQKRFKLIFAAYRKGPREANRQSPRDFRSLDEFRSLLTPDCPFLHWPS